MGMNIVGLANPCMGSFDGRGATAKHGTNKCSRFDKPLANPSKSIMTLEVIKMKLKSLILGSVAAAGLTSGAFAADLYGNRFRPDVCLYHAAPAQRCDRWHDDVFWRAYAAKLAVFWAAQESTGKLDEAASGVQPRGGQG